MVVPGVLVVTLALTVCAEVTRTALLSGFVPRTGVAGRLPAEPGRGPSYTLVVVSDRRDTLAPGAREHYGDTTGQRADAIALLRLADGQGASLLSLPRDLRVDLPGYGQQKLGAMYDFGAAGLVLAVRELTGVAVNHVVQLDFAAVGAAVDELGGVDVTFTRPARDPTTGFHATAGRRHLDGGAALAFARSRDYEEYDGTSWRPVRDDDLGRITREHELMRAAAGRAGRVRDPVRLARALWTVRGHLAVDPGLSGHRLSEILAALGGGRPLTLATLPSAEALSAAAALSAFGPPAHYGAVSYVVPLQPAAARALDAFRAGRER